MRPHQTRANPAGYQAALLGLLTIACTPSSPEPATSTRPNAESSATAPDAATDLPAKEEYFYGVYLQGAKVGWMRHTRSTTAPVTMETELQAKIRGMGRDTEVGLVETRAFDAEGLLRKVTFEHRTAGSVVSVEGTRSDAVLDLIERSAGQAQRSQAPLEGSSLEDEDAAIALAQTGKPGDRSEATRFDPSIRKSVRAIHILKEVDTRNAGGVPVEMALIRSEYPALGITEESWISREGIPLESVMGNVFKLRLEPEAEAKKVSYQQDVIISSVVKVPRPLAKPAELKALTLRLRIPTESALPSSSRQKVSGALAGGTTSPSQEVTLQLSKDASSEAPMNALPTSHPELVASSVLQTDAPSLKAKAQELVEGAATVGDAVERLVRFVSAHVKDSYVPAYSNALEVLQSGTGDCTEHTVLFVALARAAGIPARAVGGIAYWPPGEGFGWHAWAEIYDGTRWIAADPTWNQPIADATHIKLADGSPAEQARIVMLLGQIEVLELKER